MVFNILKQMFKYKEIRSKTLLPHNRFPLEIYGNLNKNIIKDIMAIINYEAPPLYLDGTDDPHNNENIFTWRDMAKKLAKVFIDNNIKCKDVDKFHKKYKFRLNEIVESDGDISELFVPTFCNIEDMKHFIEHYEMVLDENNIFKNTPISSMTYYMDNKNKWNKVTEISNKEFSKNELKFLFEKEIIIPALNSKPEFLLNSLTVEKLKTIAKEYGLKTSGKKMDLVHRIESVENIMDTLLSLRNYKNQYILVAPSSCYSAKQNEFEDFVNYYKVNEFTCLLLNHTYVWSKRYISEFENAVEIGIKKIKILNLRGCNCSKKVIEGIPVKLVKDNFPPFELGCDCTYEDIYE
ncbi:MAG: hypothetical protein GQ534_01050 [Candidatus Delongbacteria bacterium]|nr:hypothetical protein [Candidatus Delongbacteria bacterium]